jgi:hypothetical protein
MTPRQLSADDLFQEEVMSAEGMTPEERILAGPRLFEMACHAVLAGLRLEFPDASSSQLHELLSQRLQLMRDLENRPLETIS